MLKFNKETELRLSVQFTKGLSEDKKYKSLLNAAGFSIDAKWFEVIISDMRIVKNEGEVVFKRYEKLQIEREKAEEYINRATQIPDFNFIDLWQFHMNLYSSPTYKIVPLNKP